MRVAKLVDCWLELKDPERTGPLARFVRTKLFEGTCICVIMVNSVFTIVATNYMIQELSDSTNDTMQTAETFFLFWYTAEAILKIAVHRWFYFCNDDMRWNLLDVGLIALGFFDLLISMLARDGFSTNGGTFMRSFRLLKISKILRMLRVLRFFADLRLMLDCVAGSFLSLLCALLSLCSSG